MIDEKELQKIVKESIAAASPSFSKETLEEAYIAQPKIYPQTTDLLSNSTKDAHTKLYQGYVEKLTRVSAEIDVADKLNANSSSSDYSSLKRDESYLHNAVYLHELYFANCFDPNSEIFMNMFAYMRLQRDFGTFEAWQADFIACAHSNRDGWVVCGYSSFLKRFVNTFVENHSSNVMMGLYPVIVVDTHEHAYYRDYLEDRKSYIVAMMQQFNWDVIESRFVRAEKIAEALK